MTATALTIRFIEKPWGRIDLPPMFALPGDATRRIGEIWFEDPASRDDELLIKFLFTSERLSIQVHPNDAAAVASGYPRGKEEAWYILAADPGATIALGLADAMSPETLAAAARDGTIVELVDWRPVVAGDVIYSTAGTIHAIGAGIQLIEVQQNVDLTYRIYDYGRPRELHLDEGLAVARCDRYAPPPVPASPAPGRIIHAAGRKFALEQWQGPLHGILTADDRPVWLIPLSGGIALDRQHIASGTAWRCDGDTVLELDADATLLVAYAGSELRAVLKHPA